MLKKSIIKLAGSILVSALLAALLSLVIVLSIGGIGSTSADSVSSVSSGLAAATSSQTSSTETVSSSQTNSSSQVSTATSSTSKTIYTVGGIIDTTAGKIVLGLLGIFITFALVYSTGWREGNKDPNKIKFGHMTKFMPKGFISGALATIPFIIYATIYLIVDANAHGTPAGITVGAIFRGLNMQYIVLNENWINYPAACYLVLLLYPLAAGLGYIMGFKNIVLMSRLVYKKKPDSKYMKKLKR